MIIDSFTFFNELDLLELRLTLLDEHVDMFIISESDKTQSLKDKPYNLLKNWDRFKRFHSKINYCMHHGSGEFKTINDSWEQERDQRDFMEHAMANMCLSEDDIIMVSDLDEIPNIQRGMLEDLRAFENGIYTIPNKFFAYYMNLQGFDAETGNPKYSDGTVVACAKQFRKLGVDQIWAGKSRWPKLHGMSGWHLSWLGGPQKVREKALACIEPFDKSCVPSKEQMDTVFRKRVIEEGFFNINHPTDNSVRMKIAPAPFTVPGIPGIQKYFYHA